MNITITLLDGTKSIMKATSIEIDHAVTTLRICPSKDCISISEISRSGSLSITPIANNHIKVK